MKIDFNELERTSSKNPIEIESIIKSTKPDVQNKKGFWLFAEFFSKDDAYYQFGKNSPWDPTYLIYRDLDDNVVAMHAFRTKDPHLDGYAHLMGLQVLSKYSGNSLSENIMKDTLNYIINKHPNIKGFTLQCHEPSLKKLYKRYGFSPMNGDDSTAMVYHRNLEESFYEHRSPESYLSKVLYPGGFKPFHDGHLNLINDALNNSNNMVCVIISNKDRNGISPLLSKWFIDKIFGQRPNFISIISDHPSPIHKAYDITATKELGDGIYSLLSSNKDSDIQRSVKYADDFSTNGKYFTDGISSSFSPNKTPVFVYSTRNDSYNQSPVSSRIIRNDIIENNFNNFKSAYTDSLAKGLLNDEVIKEYFSRLRQMIVMPNLYEGGAAGHMNHIYDDDNITFQDIFEMIDDLFNGKITDITEKIDGINIFASMDNEGRVVFARNKTHLKNSPMTLDDIINNVKWTDDVKQSLIVGTRTIESVFKNITNNKNFFNYNDTADGLRYRTWINTEIVNSNYQNVIPYVDDFVSFHNFINTCEKYDENGTISFETFEDPNEVYKKQNLENAIKKTNNSKFKSQLTPKVILNTSLDLHNKANYYIEELEDLMYEYKLDKNSTLVDYREQCYLKYIYSHNNIFYQNIPLTKEEKIFLAQRWSGKNKTPLKQAIQQFNKDVENKKTIVNSIYSKLKEFENDKLSDVDKKIMMPLNKIFTSLGNDVIKQCDNLLNSGHELKIIEQIKNKIVKTIDDITKTKDSHLLDKLEYLLIRLGDQTELNSSEGIVFKYHGKTYKLTGSFSALNQLLNIKKYIKDEH